MNTNAILGVGVLAIIVSIAGLYALLGPQQENMAATALLTFSPSSVVEVAVVHGDGRTERVTRDTTRWHYSRDGAVGTWPVEGSTIRGALRVLADLHAPIHKGAGEDAYGASVRLTHTDGTIDTVTFGSSRVGGTVAVRVNEGVAAFVDDSIRGAFFSPGPSAWRDARAMPGVTVEASRISLTQGERSLGLARIGNRWQLASPVAHRADQQQVGALIRDILSLRASVFLDSAEARSEAQGVLSGPEFVVEVATDSRVVGATGNVSVSTARETLRVAAGAGQQEDALGHNPGHDVFFVLDAKPVAALQSRTVESLLDPTACGSLVADVSGIEIDRPGSTWRYTRTIDGWVGQAGTPEADGLGIDMLVGFLTDAGATSVRIAPMPELASWADITLLDLGQQPLESITVGIDSGGTLYVAVTTLDRQTVLLTYDESLPAMLGRFFNQP